ncbi:MAG: methyltransferase domain-containing protein [Planctomycetota bacterium]|jgi:SAM-dependent methyltransferase
MTDAEALRRAVREKYRLCAASPEDRFPYPVGRASARRLGYEERWLAAVPDDAVDRFVGVGNPFRVRLPQPGESVLDAGCGCGLDVFVASILVGPEGRAVGLDLTSEMIVRARAAAAQWSPRRVSFDTGDIEAMPFPDASFDVVLSNGSLNLVPDKDRAFREIARVLRPGGWLAAADLLVIDTIPPDVLASLDAWST